MSAAVGQDPSTRAQRREDGMHAADQVCAAIAIRLRRRAAHSRAGTGDMARSSCRVEGVRPSPADLVISGAGE